MTPGRYLAGVAALLEAPDGRILLLRRSPDRDYAPGVWECVTGRLQQGEGFEEALHREVAEETGLTARPVGLLGTVHFHRGSADPANELVGVTYLCRVAAAAPPRLSAEHDRACWVDAAEASALLVADDPATRWMRRVLARWHGRGPEGTLELG